MFLDLYTIVVSAERIISSKRIQGVLIKGNRDEHARFS